ncbi:MAG: argininosuccinate synthase [Saprospiraceae bacterium]|jgi:argininosuccinate synthase
MLKQNTNPSQLSGQNNKIVLAYSGGLDTSFCIKYLTQEKGLEVHAFTVNTGGFSIAEISKIEKQAYSLGAKSFQAINIEQEYYEKCIRFLVFGNILKNGTYPLSVSSERVFQALKVLEYAKMIGATAIAHGSTGAGNDQVRFDLIFNILGEEMEVITPIRDLQLSRQDEIDFLLKNGVDYSWEKAKYSINQGLWGTSVGGTETLTSHLPLPEEAFPSQLQKQGTQTLALHFSKGEIIGIDDQQFDTSVDVIKTLNNIASQFAIGRDTHVGDTIIGIKGRVGFEAAAALIIIKAHQLLEKHTLGKWQMYWKEQLGNWYGMLLHEGQYLDPVMRNIETFLEDTQTTVTGTVQVKLSPYQFQLLGIESPFDLMNSTFGDYGEMNKAWTGEDVKGFTKVMATSSKIYHATQNNNLVVSS